MEEAGTIKEEEHEHEHDVQVSTPSASEVERTGHLTPPIVFPQEPGHLSAIVIQPPSPEEERKLSTPKREEEEEDRDITPRPAALTPPSGGSSGEIDPDPTPKGASSPLKR